MTKRDWLSVALKTSGVVLAILYLQAFILVLGLNLRPSVWRGTPGWRSTVELLLALGGTAGGVVVAVLLTAAGDRLADRLLKTDVAADDTGLQGQHGIFFAGLKFIGVVAATQGLVHLPACIGSVVNFPRLLYEHAPALSILIRQVAWPLVLLAISAYLIFGGKRLMRLAYGREIEETAGVGPWTPQSLFALALRVLGVVLVTLRLPVLVRFLLTGGFPLQRKALVGGALVIDTGLEFFEWLDLLLRLVILAVAVYLISGARRLVTFVFRKPDADSPAAA
ncbi:MAG TPA: hypothetical protein VMW52_05990 [Phycisphaerae bacterium]|nr:hypothetical protein [Phycisphaerae bacterium]